MFKRFIMVTAILASAAHAQGLKEETASVKLRISEEQVFKVISANEVAGVEQLIAAGWDPAQPMKRGQRRNSVGLLEPVTIYPLAQAIADKAFDVARVIGARTAVETMDLRNAAGEPAWYPLAPSHQWSGWNAANPQQSVVSAELMRIFLRSRTPRVHKDANIIISLYETWSVRGTDRLSFFRDGLIAARDLEGGVGRRVLYAALKQYRLNAAISERDAAEEIKALFALGAGPETLTFDDLYGPAGVLFKSCARFNIESGAFNYCGYDFVDENFAAADPRAVHAMLDNGWKPNQKSIDAQWSEKLFRRGTNMVDMGMCGFRTDTELLVLAMTWEGKGFRTRSDSSLADELELLDVAEIRPSKAVVTKLQSTVDRYQKSYEGKSKCNINEPCPPASQTACGALLLKLGGKLR